jgi:hypothetical protein
MIGGKKRSNAINTLSLSFAFYEHPIIITMTEKLIFRAGVRMQKKNRIISPLYKKKRWRKCLIVIAGKKWALVRNKKTK